MNLRTVQIKIGKRTYVVPEIYKAIVAAATSVVTLLALVTVIFAKGDVAIVGAYAAAALLILNPVLVFLKRQEVRDIVGAEDSA